MSTLFLSDLHLPPYPSPLRTAFQNFLSGPARAAEAVYILGDLFEVWIGDDCGAQDYAAEIAALQKLGTQVPVFFMHGNRDFLVGPEFSAMTGVRVLQDPLVIDLYGVRTLLSHGDRYCTDDTGYQRWRRFSRQPLMQRGYRGLPLFARKAIAAQVRSTSLVQKRSKAEDIMDVNAQAIAGAFAEHQVTRMIHGHTHRPAQHSIEVNGTLCERIVLADWHPEHCEYLQISPDSATRLSRF